MIYGSMVLGALLQASHADTLIARVIPVRGVLDLSSGILQLIVLLLGIGSLVTLVVLLLTVRAGVQRVNVVIEQFAADTKPLISKATAVVTDARDVVATLRNDVERVTRAAGAVSDQLLDAADTTARRVDDVNAVLDVLQGELEASAISAAALIRGVRTGARSLSGERRRRRDGSSDSRE